MPRAVKLVLEGVELRGELNQSAPARELAARLPLELELSRWGREYYGALDAPLPAGEEKSKEVMALGELAYWQPGQALCLFFGPTPASRGDEPRAASPVLSLGRVQGDWQALDGLGPQVRARLEEAQA